MSTMSHSQLRRWYTAFNKKWFNSELPADMDVFYTPKDGCVEEAWHCSETEEHAIEVNTGVCSKQCSQWALMHGMNHHYTGQWNHGQKFQDGMNRLAMLGAFKKIW